MRKTRLKELKLYLKDVKGIDITTPEGKKCYKMLKKKINSKEVK